MSILPDVTHPYCIACGGLVGYYELYGPRYNHYSPLPVKIDPDSRVQWTSLYRAIFLPERHRSPSLQVSGIGRYDAWTESMLKVTWDSDSSNINTPQWIDVDRYRDYIWALNCFNYSNWDKPSAGYLIHANCWALLERRFLCRRVMESNLQLLLDICGERFHENPYDIRQFGDPDTYGEKTSTPTPTWLPPEDSFCIPHEFRYPEGVNICKLENKRTRHVIALRDPLKIPEIPKLIRHSMQDKAREGMKRKTRKWSSFVSFPQESRTSRTQSREYQLISRLPLDITFLILDCLSGYWDIRNALMSFDWRVPDQYWRPRVPRDLIFELEDVSRPEDINWKSLFLGICYLRENSPELKNRERVLGLLEEIARRFRERCPAEN